MVDRVAAAEDPPIALRWSVWTEESVHVACR